MKDNHLLIFKINVMYKYFEDLMRIDFYDRCTLEWYSRDILKEVSLNEMRKIEESIIMDINKSSRSNTSFWGGLGVLAGLFIGTFAILVAMYSDLKLEYDTAIFWLFFILFGLFIIILIAFNFEQSFNKKRDKLHDLIRMLIYIKECE